MKIRKKYILLTATLILFNFLSFSQATVNCFENYDNGDKIRVDYILTKDSIMHKFPDGIKRTWQRFGKLKISKTEEYKYTDMLAFQMGETNYRVIGNTIFRRVVSGKINVFQSTAPDPGQPPLFLQKGNSNELVHFDAKKSKNEIYNLLKDNEKARIVVDGYVNDSKKLSDCKLASAVNAYNSY